MNALTVIPPEPVEGEIVGNGVFLEANPFAIGRFRWIGVADDARLIEYYAAAAAELPPAYRPHIELWIDEHRIERTYWRNVTPKPGACVYARVRPGSGKSGKNVLRAVLMIAIVIAASVLLAPGSPIWASIGITSHLGAAVASAVAITAVTTVAMLAINALIPAPGLTGENTTPKPSLTGSSNQFAPYATVPRVFGKLRVSPLLAGYPYTEVVGNKQYLRMLLLVGWGPIKISDIRIGETPISDYDNVEIEITEGGPGAWAGNRPITLYNRKVSETPLQIALTHSGGVSSVQTTAANAVEIGVDITFPFGLIYIDKDGNRNSRSVSFRIEYAVHGSGVWNAAPLESAYTDSNTLISGNAVTATATSNDAVRVTARFKVAAGQYDVRVTRTTSDSVNTTSQSQTLDGSYWTTLRTFSSDTPVVQTGVCLIALRMQASDQLNGVPQQINCIAEAYLPVYDGTSWSYQITRSPAWAFADVLRNRGGQTLIPDNRIDYAGSIASWAADCAATAPNADEQMWTFDGVIEGGTVIAALSRIAATGRAAYTMRDGKFAVVQDKSQATPVQIITPKNSWGYSGSRTYLQQPDALRVQFTNADLDYRPDEVIVYQDGQSAATAKLFEVLPLQDCVSKTMGWREGRYHMAVALLRPEEHKVSMDIEGLRCTRGDRVELAYDVMATGKTWGRISSIVTSGANTVGFTVDEDCEFVAGFNYQLRVRHHDGTISTRTVTMSGGPGVTRVLTCSAEPTSGGPQIDDVYVFGETSIETAAMIVKKIEPGDDLSVVITMTNYDEGIYTADTGTIPPFTSFLLTDATRTPPANPTVSIRGDGTTHQLNNGNWVLNRLGVDIYNPSDRVPLSGNQVQYRETGNTIWRDALPLLHSTGETTVYIDDGILVGHAYQVRARARGENGLYSDWVQPADVVVIAISLRPYPPTAASLEQAYRSVILRWTNPSDLDFAYVEVTAATVNNYASSILIGRSVAGSFTHDNLNPSTTWYYWLRSIDFAGNISDPVAVGWTNGLSIAQYEGIGADGVLTPAEKQVLIREFADLTNEKLGIDAQATNYGITTEKSAYDSAYSTLNALLGSYSPAWNDTSQNTSINRVTWNGQWEALYSSRQTLLNKIDATAGVSAAPGDANRVRFSQCERGITGYALYDITSSSISQISTGTSSGGVPYVTASATFAANGQELSIGTDGPSIAADRIPVTPGERLFVSAMVGGIMPNSLCSKALMIMYYNSSNVAIDTEIVWSNFGSDLFPTQAQGFTPTVPVGAAWAQVRWHVTNNSVGVTGAFSIYLGQVMVCGAGAGQTVFPPFSPGRGNLPSDNSTAYSIDALASYSFPYAYDTSQSYSSINVIAHLKDQSGVNIGTGLTWTYAVISGSVNGNAGDGGVSEYPMTLDAGFEANPYITVTSLGANSNVVEIRAYQGVIMWPKRTEFVKDFASAPPPSGSSSSLPVSGGVSMSVTSTTPASAGTLNGTPSSTTVNLTANIDISTGGPTGSATVVAQFQRLIGGTWTNVGSSGSGTATYNRYEGEIDGSISLTVTDTVTAGTAYQWRVVLSLLSGTKTAFASGTIIAS